MPNKEPLGGYRHICPICGKDFRAWLDWAYKKKSGHGYIYFCSWKCRRQDEKNEEIRKAKRKEQRRKCSENTTTAP